MLNVPECRDCVGVDILNVSTVYFTPRATAELKLKQKGQTWMNTKEAKAAGEGRRERWLKLADVQLAEIRDNPFYVQREVFEEIEGRNLAEVITDHLCTFRGVGVVNAGPEAKYKFEADEWYERQSSRKRGAHDREIVRRAVFDFLMPGVYVGMFDQKEIRAFTRKFYRVGDIGLREAKDRALRYALEH